MIQSQSSQMGIFENTTKEYEKDVAPFLRVSDPSDVKQNVRQVVSHFEKLPEDVGRAGLFYFLVKRQLARFSKNSITTIRYSDVGLESIPMLTESPEHRYIDEMLDYDIVSSVSPPIKEEEVTITITKIEKCPSIRKQ